MIDEFNADRSGWARFSDDRVMRYRLGRALINVVDPDNVEYAWKTGGKLWRRCVFLLLNPSTADAFKLDPTVKRCVAFARAWGADVLEVVNIFALRSTDPKELYKRAWGERGDDVDNDKAIVEACTGAYRVVAGWGKHGALGNRGAVVRRMLADCGVKLHHLGLNGDRTPKHSLYIKGGTEPQEWTL